MFDPPLRSRSCAARRPRSVVGRSAAVLVSVSIGAGGFGASSAGAVVDATLDASTTERPVSMASLPADGFSRGSEPRERWRALPIVGGRGAAPSALAARGRDDLAIGDERGVSWWRDAATERAVLPPVRDLEFDAEGVLWIATLEGLYSWDRSDRPVLHRMRGGEASNEVHRLAVSESALLVATSAGAYWSPDGRIFQLLRVAGAATPVSLVAIHSGRSDRFASKDARPGARRGPSEAWLYGAGRLSVVRGFEADAGMRVIDAERVRLPRPVGDGEPVDLLIDPADERLFLIFEDEIAWHSLSESATDGMAEPWHRESPVLPPGATIRRLGWAAGRIWITTDHGLVASRELAGPYRRAASPVGTTECVELRAHAPAEALALCRAGVFLLSSRPTRDGSLGEALRVELAADPPLVEIRRRALERAGLSVRRSHSLWDRLRRRAFWPEVGIRLDADFDSDHQDDRDQSFVSGETRRLHDLRRDEGRSYGAAIEFDWDLGGVVYPLESVDLSRELRQVVSLRDDVADEINQLYFERQSIREQLENADAPSGEDARRLRWRARELDAGLDAWTGGWITQWRAQRVTRAPADPQAARISPTGPDIHPDPDQERIQER